MKHPTAQDWEDYIGMVSDQQKLVDLLTPENKAHIWEWGFDAVEVRRMLAAQRRAGINRRAPRQVIQGPASP